jgi:hypothetical protein
MRLSLPVASVSYTLNFPDGMYTATTYLSKALPQNPFIFPIMKEMAVINPDETLDYSSLFYQAKDEYSALDSFSRILNDYIPEFLDSEQKNNLKKSFEYIRSIDTKDAELGKYCKYVYGQLDQRFGPFVGLEPLPITESREENAIATAISEASESADNEVVLERRAEKATDELFNEELNGFYSDSNVSPDFIEEFMFIYNATLYTLLELAEIEGEKMFEAAEIVTSRAETMPQPAPVTAPNAPDSNPVREVVLERRAPSNLENLQKYSEEIGKLRPVFMSKDHKLEFVLGKVAKVAKTNRLDNNIAIICQATAVGAAVSSKFQGTGSHVIQASIDLTGKTAKFITQTNQRTANADVKNDSVYAMLDLDIIASILREINASGNPEPYDSLIFRALQSFKLNRDLLAVERMWELSADSNQEQEKVEKMRELGVGAYLLVELEALLNQTGGENLDRIDRIVNLLNKLAISYSFDKFGLNGIDMHESKTTWLKTLKDPDVQASLSAWKTPVNHIENNINILVQLIGNDFPIDSRNMNDIALFFADNQSSLNGLGLEKRLEARKLYINIVHHLSNCQSRGEYSQDIISLKKILIGEDNMSGLFGNALTSQASLSAAEMLCNGKESSSTTRSLAGAISIQLVRK